jgi:hypothetical protein
MPYVTEDNLTDVVVRVGAATSASTEGGVTC